MGISQAHNLSQLAASAARPFGIRVSLKPGDPFRNLLGEAWNRTHWYATAAERDAALADMLRKHEYSRPGDRPAIVCEKAEKLSKRAA